MALPQTDITTAAVGTYIGLASGNVSTLCAKTGLNKYSFYAPGQLSVDANKDVVLTPPSGGYKLGDFRLYDKLALTPSAQANYQQNWGPALTNYTFAVSWFPQNMNIKDFSISGDYVTMNFYSTATDRTNEANRRFQQINSISYSAITPLVGHSRTTSYNAGSTQAPVYINNFPVSGLTTPDQILYLETFISDIAGNRKINLGVRANNYTTVTMHQSQTPYMVRSGNITPVPTGYTASWIEITPASTLCDTATNLNQTFGGTTYSFYARIRGVYSAANRIMQQSTCSVTLTLRGDAQVVKSTVLNYSGSATLISGTLSNGKTWAYDDVATITCSATFPTTPLYTTC